MASSVSLPTFEDEEILTYEKLNAAFDAINARFTAGIGTADLSWPLTAEGNLDMSVFNIIGGQQIWDFVNAAEYDTLTEALSAAGAGGVVLVPPGTTITSSGGESFAGSGATILGSGPSSIIKFDAAPTAGYLLRVNTGTGIRFMNLRFDGNSAAGTSQLGLDIQGCSDVLIHGCEFVNFSGAALKLSAGCTDVKISDCYFSGGDEEHIYVTECHDLQINNVRSDTAGAVAVRMECAGVSNYIRAKLSNIEITDSGGAAIKMLGANVPGSVSPAELYVSNVNIENSGVGANGVEIGSSVASVMRVSWTGGKIESAAAGAMLVNASGGTISGVSIDDPATFCIDLDTSQYVSVCGNILRDGTIGIDAGDTTAECLLNDNIISGCTADVVIGGTSLRQYNNGTQVGTTLYNSYANLTATSGTVDVDFNACTVTIPADTLRVGSVLRCRACIQGGGNANTQYARIYFGGSAVGYCTYKGPAGTYSVIESIVTVTNTTSVRSFYTGMAENISEVYAGNNNVGGLDFTAAITASVHCDQNNNGGGTNASVQGLVITLHHTELQ